MVGSLVSIVQQKGGVGKTTLTAQLAVALSMMRMRIALLDLDPQASLTEWFEAREQFSDNRGMDLVLKRATSNLAATIEEMRRSADVVLIDGPSHADAETRIAILFAELVIIPCQPRPFDVWATEQVLNLARRARRQAMLVLNRVPVRSRLAERIRQDMVSKNWPVAKPTLGERQAFAATVEFGHGVAEVEPGCRASQEIMSLARDVLTRLGCPYPAELASA